MQSMSALHRITVVKNDNYTAINNTAVRDSRLSLKAKGLFLTIMSLPPDWDFTIRGIISIVKESRGTIYSTFKELEKYGYCYKEAVRERGKFASVSYVFYEVPCDKKPHPVLPDTEKRDTKNRPQLNTKELNTKPIKEKINRESVMKKSHLNKNQNQEKSAYSLEQRFSALQKGQRMGLFAGVENLMALATARQDGQMDFLVKELLDLP